MSAAEAPILPGIEESTQELVRNAGRSHGSNMQQHSIIAYVVLLLLALATLITYPVQRYAEVIPPSQLGPESLGLADSIAHGRGFSDPFVEMQTGPSAQLAPAFPAFLAFILLHTSSDSAAYFAMEWCATLIVVFQICLMPLLARRLGLGFYSGVAASVLWLVARVPREVVWEQNYSGVLITMLAYLMYDALREQMSLPRLVLCAVLWGVLILLCPVALLALVAWILLVHFARTQTLAQKLVLATLPILILAPWLLRNYQTFHRFVFVRDNLGLELEVSNNPCASFSFEVNRITNCYAQHHPNENLREASNVAALGEVTYNQQRLHVAREWILDHPRDFVGLTAKRFAAFWFPSSLSSEQSVIRNPNVYSPLRDAIVSLASVAMVAGLVLLWRRNRSACSVLIVWLVTFPPVYYMTQYSERARLPVQWAIMLPACYVASELWQRLAPKDKQLKST